MESEKKLRFSLKSSLSVQTLLGTVIVVALVWFMGGTGEQDGTAVDPAGDAEAAFSSIRARIASGGQDGTTSTGSSLVLAGSEGVRIPSLGRNLFAADVQEQRRYEAAKGGKKPTRRKPKTPHLSAILIDGKTRQAVLSGEIAAPGDVVNGFLVLEIGSEWVRLEMKNKEYQLWMESD